MRLQLCQTQLSSLDPDAAPPPAKFLPSTYQWSHWPSAWILSQLNLPSQLCIFQTDALTLDNLDPHELSFRLASKSDLHVGDALLHSAAVPRVGYHSQFFDPDITFFLIPDVLKPIYFLEYWNVPPKDNSFVWQERNISVSAANVLGSEPRPGPFLPSGFLWYPVCAFNAKVVWDQWERLEQLYAAQNNCILPYDRSPGTSLPATSLLQFWLWLLCTVTTYNLASISNRVTSLENHLLLCEVLQIMKPPVDVGRRGYCCLSYLF